MDQLNFGKLLTLKKTLAKNRSDVLQKKHCKNFFAVSYGGDPYLRQFLLLSSVPKTGIF